MGNTRLIVASQPINKKRAPVQLILPGALAFRGSVGTLPAMRVKRLEIQGFKSFKDKTVVHFDHGITGIVGPNGCGKSNIVDSFFWVMGEMSYKHMRGSGSEDLIFNGSSRYSPLGMAEATLVLETEEVDPLSEPAGASATDEIKKPRKKEVSVTRRVYRGGEGEYFVNGLPARLRDIQELFMDTGIGAKGYSVIEQGQIDKVVNSKPDERRTLIEEAAGIAKYKARKKESLRKLEGAQTNLSRLTDVLQEIERSLGTLERQAQKARRYKEYKDELFQKEVTWGRRKAKVVEHQLIDLRTEKETLEQTLVGVKAELHTIEAQIETSRIEQIASSKKIEELQSGNQALNEDLSHHQGALELSRQRQGDISRQIQSLIREQKEIQEWVEKEEINVIQKREEAVVIQDQWQEFSESLIVLNQELNSARRAFEEARAELERVKTEHLTHLAQSNQSQVKLSSLSAKIESSRQNKSRVEMQVQEQNERRSEFEMLAATAQELIATAQKDKATLEAELLLHTETVSETERLIRTEEKEKDRLFQDFSKRRSRLQSLEELSAAYEGIGGGAKSLLGWAKNSGKPVHLLANGLKVNKGYEQALEGWMETRLEMLGTDSVATALDAMDFATSSKKGRIAIQVVNTQEKQNKAESERLEQKTRALLKELNIEDEGTLDQYVSGSQGAFFSTLSEVLVLKNSSDLKTVLSKIDSNLENWPMSLVTRDGFAWETSGLVRGGATSESEKSLTFLGRKREIDDLKIQVAELESAYTSKVAEIDQLKEKIQASQEQLKLIRPQLQAAQVSLAQAERDLQQSNRQIQDSARVIERLNSESSQLAEVLETCENEKAVIEERLNELLLQADDYQSSLAAQTQTVEELNAAYRSINDRFQSLKIEEATRQERTHSIQRELKSATQYLEARKNRLGEVTVAMESLDQQRNGHSNSDESLSEKVKLLTVALSEKQAELSEIKNLHQILSNDLNEKLDRLKFLHSNGDSQTGRVTELAIELERLSGELSHLRLNLEEKYGAGCLESTDQVHHQEEMENPIVTAEISAETEKLLFEEVEQLRERIRRLGEVNLVAIEEFEETQKRFDHLTQEKLDLEKSILNLQEAIEHINRTSEDRFRKAFEAIAQRFEKMFPIVFGGGHAQLSLVYPEGSQDILEAGVDILAQPPGKKVTNIGLLSGGEKALTAITLVFSIFMVKPSPFCLLDEVDAPLDDSNIGKFNALLREMSKRTQFIIITHNKKTMELNDTLYGVTMEEPGVSKIVSVEMGT